VALWILAPAPKELHTKRIYQQDIESIRRWCNKLLRRYQAIHFLSLAEDDCLQDGVLCFLDMVSKHDFRKSDFAPIWFEHEFLRRIIRRSKKMVGAGELDQEAAEDYQEDMMLAMSFEPKEKQLIELALTNSREVVCQELQISRREYDKIHDSIRKKLGI